jgi:hypothetical protein
MFILGKQTIHLSVRMVLPSSNKLSMYHRNASVTMAAALAGILTLAVLTIAIQHQAFAQAYNQGSSYDNNNQCCEKQQQPPQCCEKQQQPPQCCEPQQQPEKKIDVTKVAKGGNGGSGGAGGAGGEGGAGGKNIVTQQQENKGYQDTAYVSSSGSINQKANGGDANGGHGGNANGGNANIGNPTI